MPFVFLPLFLLDGKVLFENNFRLIEKVKIQRRVILPRFLSYYSLTLL